MVSILFFLNHQKSEVFIMVCFAIVAYLDPAHRRQIEVEGVRKKKYSSVPAPSAKSTQLTLTCRTSLKRGQNSRFNGMRHGSVRHLV